MSALFGIFHRDGRATSQETIETMRTSLAAWGCDGGIWTEGPCGLGQVQNGLMPDDRAARPLVDGKSGVVLVGAARLDSLSELPGSEQAAQTDLCLIQQAYLRWGEDCVQRLLGDWAFAAWHPVEKRLFLARDQYGNTSLYYYRDPQVFAFASDRKALLALGLAAWELDELYLGQVIVSWQEYQGERTIYKQIHRLPPAHHITVTPGSAVKRYYWRLEDTPEARLAGPDDYAECLSEILEKAVKDRLRPPGTPSRGIDLSGRCLASTLSAGLDSGSISVTAAQLLSTQGARLAAFTAVPIYDTGAFQGDRIGDELPLAQATARFAGNIDVIPVRSETITPIQAIRRVLQIHGEPVHATSNCYWLLELERSVRELGYRVLLTAQSGNAGLSWAGDSRFYPVQSRFPGGRSWAREWQRSAQSRLRRAAHLFLPRRVLQLRVMRTWRQRSALHPRFARQIALVEQFLDFPGRFPARTPRERRLRWLMPGRHSVGALHAQMGAAHGLEIRDPSADVRLLTFTMSIPDRFFVDPETGLDRWILRAAMRGRLPDEVRLNRRRGRQAADLVPRLRASAAEVEETLDELARGPAAGYVDVAHMRRIWETIQVCDSREALRAAGTILTRGIMAGLFVNEFYGVS